MRTTTEQTDSGPEDRATELTGRLHPDHAAQSPAATKAIRKTVGWSVVGVVGVAAVLVATLVADDMTDKSVHDLAATGDANVDNPPTELDIRGIPTWWSGEPAAPQRNHATEVDIHGIPTWWSGERAASRA